MLDASFNLLHELRKQRVASSNFKSSEWDDCGVLNSIGLYMSDLASWLTL